MLQAIDHLSDALTHWRAAGDRAEVAKTLYTIGSTYIEIGDQKKALEHTTLALAAAHAANDRRAEARATSISARCITISGDKRKAAGFMNRPCH
jgi:tetratricopeptide (TPR) repeat protein